MIDASLRNRSTSHAASVASLRGVAHFRWTTWPTSRGLGGSLRWNTHYGHKLTVSAGSSGLILDWVIEDGNPTDSTLVTRTIERQKEIYGRVPRQMAFDGCYASGENLKKAKDLGVQDVAFSKKRGLEVLDMAKSQWVYKRLRNFRAGMKAWISFLKRCFGLERCSWRGASGIARYVGASIVAANLLTLAPHLA